mmetsp:Transcript_20453/g.41588  ORF Transcript_20453/g.41588 Transcript_20453/m.41588 type:complete len:252 (-) Transcript_20453:1412-2167(-)
MRVLLKSVQRNSADGRKCLHLLLWIERNPGLSGQCSSWIRLVRQHPRLVRQHPQHPRWCRRQNADLWWFDPANCGTGRLLSNSRSRRSCSLLWLLFAACLLFVFPLLSTCLACLKGGTFRSEVFQYLTLQLTVLIQIRLKHIQLFRRFEENPVGISFIRQHSRPPNSGIRVGFIGFGIRRSLLNTDLLICPSCPPISSIALITPQRLLSNRERCQLSLLFFCLLLHCFLLPDDSRLLVELIASSFIRVPML